MELIYTDTPDFELAVGGFWISPEGLYLKVCDYCDHYATISKAGLGGYVDAYARGWIRVSFCGPSTTQVTYDNPATGALKALAVLLRAPGYPDKRVMLEDCARPYWADDRERDREFATPGVAASWIMRQVLIRNAEAKAERALEPA